MKRTLRVISLGWGTLAPAIVANGDISTPQRSPKSLFGQEKLSVHLSATTRRKRVEQALAQGGVEMGVPIILYISRVVPNAGLLDLPVFYGRSAEEIHAVMDGAVGAELNAEIEDVVGVKIIGPNLDLGHGSIFTTEVPTDSLASLAGLKLRVPGSPAAKVRYDSLDVESVSISFADVPISLALRAAFFPTVVGSFMQAIQKTMGTRPRWPVGMPILIRFS